MSLDVFECYCDFDGSWDWQNIHRYKSAGKDHRCGECGGQIARGEPYEYMAGKWCDGYDNDVEQHKTCSRCLEVRDFMQTSLPCFCWTYGNLIDDAWRTAREAVEFAPTDRDWETSLS